MDRRPAAARSRALAAGAALLAMAASSPVRAAVTLQATSAQVSSQGGNARVCVMLSTDGEQVAGIQTDIRWDGTCATLPSKEHCVPAGSHGKGVHADIDKQQADFTARVLVLSLSDVDVIPDGPVFCCDFQGEADPGSCCSLSLVNTGASDPKGKAIPANSGRPASICTSGSGNQPGRGFGSQSGQGPLSASNAPAPGEGAAAPAAPAPAALPGGGGAPVAQVLPGGGARVESAPEAAVIPPTVPAIQLPTPPAVSAPTAPAAVLTPQPPLPPPTAAATSAPTLPTAADTPVTRPTVAAAATKATVAPTKPAAAKQQAEPPPAQATEERGWFGCQIEAGASGGPVIGLGLLALLGVAVRRRRR